MNRMLLLILLLVSTLSGCTASFWDASQAPVVKRVKSDTVSFTVGSDAVRVGGPDTHETGGSPFCLYLAPHSGMKIPPMFGKGYKVFLGRNDTVVVNRESRPGLFDIEVWRGPVERTDGTVTMTVPREPFGPGKYKVWSHFRPSVKEGRVVAADDVQLPWRAIRAESPAVVLDFRAG